MDQLSFMQQLGVVHDLKPAHSCQLALCKSWLPWLNKIETFVCHAQPGGGQGGKGPLVHSDGRIQCRSVGGCSFRIMGRRGFWVKSKSFARFPRTGSPFTHVRPGIGSFTVGLRVEPLAVEEDVLDELHVSVEAQGLVVDEALACVGAG